jgi:hypothetical protein
MRSDSTTKARAVTQLLAATQITGCFLQCWDEIWQTLAITPEFELTDSFLLGVQRRATGAADSYYTTGYIELRTKAYS